MLTAIENSAASTENKPVKVLYCIDRLVRGGTELQLIGLIKRLDTTRYQPYLLTLRSSDPALTPANCNHLAWDVPKLFSFQGMKAMWHLAKWLRQEKIAIVQTFFQDSTFFAALASRLAGTPARIACFRDLGFWSDRKQYILMRLAYPLMTGFISNAEIVREHFAGRFGIDREKIRVLRNGIETRALRYVEHHGPTLKVGIVGNMTRQVKRTDLFLKAAAIVAQNHPEVEWHIIGDGHMRPRLEWLAEQKGIVHRVIFAGAIADVAGYLERLEVGVLCSDSEGLSNALLEYMFKGTAAVATAVGGNTELVQHEETGLLVPPDDETALAEALKRLIEYPDLRQKLSRAARLKVESEYSWDSCLGEHQSFYQAQLSREEKELSR